MLLLVDNAHEKISQKIKTDAIFKERALYVICTRVSTLLWLKMALGGKFGGREGRFLKLLSQLAFFSFRLNGACVIHCS